MITIREAIADDAAEITKLSHQLGYSISEQQTVENINAMNDSTDHKVFVAVHQQRVIGWMGMFYTVSVQSLPLCEIHGLVVHEQFRGKGVGKMLVEKAKEWTKGRRINKLRLRCNIKRTEALRFYEHIGFTQVKQQMVFDMEVDG